MNKPITFEEWFNSLTKPGEVLDSYSTMLPNTKLTMKAALAAGWQARQPEIDQLRAKMELMEEALDGLVEYSRGSLELSEPFKKAEAALNGGKV